MLTKTREAVIRSLEERDWQVREGFLVEVASSNIDSSQYLKNGLKQQATAIQPTAQGPSSHPFFPPDFLPTVTPLPPTSGIPERKGANPCSPNPSTGQRVFSSSLCLSLSPFHHDLMVGSQNLA